MSHLKDLIITLKTNHDPHPVNSLWMTVTPGKEDVVANYIADRLANQLDLYFIDASGVCHAGAKFSAVDEAKIVTRQSFVPDTADCNICVDIFFSDGTKITKTCEYPLVHKVGSQLSSIMTASITDNVLQLDADHRLAIDVTKMIGFNLSRAPSCSCSLQKLQLHGCPSTRNFRCPSV